MHGVPPLDVLEPLLGDWIAEGEGDAGPYVCRRRFRRILHDTHVQLDTSWEHVPQPFSERTIFGVDEVDGVRYWTFSSRGEQTVGRLTTDATLPAGSVVLEAAMVTGRMRTSYRPINSMGVLSLAVETRSRTDWVRVFEHHYRPRRPS